MHELVDQALHEGFIQLGIAIQGHHDIGVDHAGEGGRVGALAAAHITVVVDCVGKYIFYEPVLAQTEGLHSLEGFALTRGEPHGQVKAVKARVPAGEAEIRAGHSVQRGGDVALVVGSDCQLLQERVECFLQQAVQQSALAAEVVVQGRFLDAGRITDRLHAHGIVALAGEQVQRALEQILTVIHCGLVYHSVY